MRERKGWLMLDIKLIRQNPDNVRKALGRKKAAELLEQIITVDNEWRSVVDETNKCKAGRNKASAEIAKLKSPEKEKRIAEVKGLGDRIAALDAKQAELDIKRNGLLMVVPNMPDESVPDGEGEQDNVVVRKWGTPKELPFKPKTHHEIGEALGILDIQKGVMLSGSRFYTLWGDGTRLEWALMQFMLDTQVKENGYLPIYPPFIVSEETMTGTGNLPKFEQDLYKTREGLYLVPTAEVPLTNLHRGEILEKKDLPKHYTAYTPCWRTEAGAHGKDTAGIFRVHQFNKVEMVKLCTQEESFNELEAMIKNAESILQKLEIPYRIVALCSADLGFSAAKTYDMEAWLPGQNTYREISSCSNCTDFQARRMNTRYRDGNDIRFVHTLNGSGIAIGRTWIAVVENYQREDGTIEVPKALRPYMGQDEILPRKK